MKRSPFGNILLWGGIALGLAAGVFWTVRMPGCSHRGSLPPLTGDEAELAGPLGKHVRKLAGTIGERNTMRYQALERASDYIHARFAATGFQVREQWYTAQGRKVRNIWVQTTGTVRPEEIVVIGAHYDSPPGSPGADDNASGVAALLELARLTRDSKPGRTVRFVAFVNEEPPFFQTDLMGSRVYAAEAGKRKERIVAMLSLESIGYFSDAAGSQSYPFPFSLFYPDTGNFIALVGNFKSRRLLYRTIKEFRATTPFPSEGVAAPESVTGIGWSDHWSFWQEGYPAIMVTDTAPFRKPHYHQPTDTPDRIDYGRLARVTAGLGRIVRVLAK